MVIHLGDKHIPHTELVTCEVSLEMAQAWTISPTIEAVFNLKIINPTACQTILKLSKAVHQALTAVFNLVPRTSLCPQAQSSRPNIWRIWTKVASLRPQESFTSQTITRVLEMRTWSSITKMETAPIPLLIGLWPSEATAISTTLSLWPTLPKSTLRSHRLQLMMAQKVETIDPSREISSIGLKLTGATIAVEVLLDRLTDCKLPRLRSRYRMVKERITTIWNCITKTCRPYQETSKVYLKKPPMALKHSSTRSTSEASSTKSTISKFSKRVKTISIQTKTSQMSFNRREASRHFRTQ